MELEPALEAAVTEKMSLQDAVGHGKAQARRDVLEFFPHSFSVRFFDFHWFNP